MDNDKMKANEPTILGIYEGECADADITNKNGMDIPRDVWEKLFASDDYKTAIKLGHYIGFLGHPEDPGCQDFEHACIVMTEGHIDDDGKVYGKFNLINTPVGRIVKTFQDAGVKFGISVRGAGDVIDNVVDADTFVFRGFDLVSFPAYPNSIPTFKNIAASTDVNTQLAYRAVCAAVDTNIRDIDDITTLEEIQCQFAKQSPQYAAIEQRKAELRSKCSEDIDDNLDDVYGQRIKAMTRLYLDAVAECGALKAENAKLEASVSASAGMSKRKLDAIRRISASQIDKLSKLSDERDNQNKTLIAANQRLKTQLSQVTAANLKYEQKMNIVASQLSTKDKTISDLRAKLDETVTQGVTASTRASNLDAKMTNLQKRVTAAETMLAEYQRAYVKLYANAIGVNSDNIAVSGSATVAELQQIIAGPNTSATTDQPVNDISVVSTDDEYDLVTI